MRHPAEYFIKFILLQDRQFTDAQVLKTIKDWGFLEPEDSYFGFLRQELRDTPPNFDPRNRLHRPSMQYLREKKVYEMFVRGSAIEEAFDTLSDPTKRMVVEQIILARLDLKAAAHKVNAKYNWHLTENGLEMFRHYFWNIKLLTFDQWGRYLYDRSAMYDRYMALLQAPPQLAYFHLRLDQVMESKAMIKRAQEIAYYTLEEVNQVPGVREAKIKAIGTLTKSINECHASLSTSDMALNSVLDEFKKFRMQHPEPAPPAIHELAPGGNYSGSGAEVIDAEKEPAK
jgi:hypothetical protein